VNSDLPGLVLAQVTENIYDSVTGRVLLIPQGARLIGAYDSVVAFGQSRALLVWQRIVMPDGSSIQFDNLPAEDAAGYAGLKDEVDYHTWQLLKGVALSTLLGVGAELSLGRGKRPGSRAPAVHTAERQSDWPADHREEPQHQSTITSARLAVARLSIRTSCSALSRIKGIRPCRT
jgi:type IV secretory pathway VirB10-like protein